MCAKPYYLWITLNNIFIAFACILFLFSIMAHQPILYQFTKQLVAHISIDYQCLMICDCEYGCTREWCIFLKLFL